MREESVIIELSKFCFSFSNTSPAYSVTGISYETCITVTYKQYSIPKQYLSSIYHLSLKNTPMGIKKKSLVPIPSIKEIQAISQKKNGKRLTTKQAFFIQKYVETGNASEAGREIYAQRQQGVENLSKPVVQEVIESVWEKTGLTDEYLGTKIQEGIEEASVEGKRLNYIETALKLKGHLKNVSVNLSHSIKETKQGYSID